MHLFSQGLGVATEFGYITVFSNFLLFFTLSIFFNESGFRMIGFFLGYEQQFIYNVRV